MIIFHYIQVYSVVHTIRLMNFFSLITLSIWMKMEFDSRYPVVV